MSAAEAITLAVVAMGGTPILIGAAAWPGPRTGPSRAKQDIENYKTALRVSADTGQVQQVIFEKSYDLLTILPGVAPAERDDFGRRQRTLPLEPPWNHVGPVPSSRGQLCHFG